MARRRLTKQQKNRIQAIQEKRRIRLDSKARQSLSEADDNPSLDGRVVIRHGATLGVMDGQGKLFRCQTRQHIGHPVCGDWVIWQPVDETTGVVTALQPRSSVLSRPDYSGRHKPLAANITQLVIVLAPKPEPSGYLLDQYLVTAETI
ncbi:MAG: ribosome small subunit-dependent GTPase, partial [gamma proteobacterium symbiont of Ctena orbiculata]